MKKIKIIFISVFSFINLFIFAEALMPSKASSVQSESIADAIGGIIQTISKNDFSYTPIEELSIEGPSEISLGRVERYEARVKPKNASFPSLIWESLNPDVARVNQSGRVTGIKEGTAEIKVTWEENKEIFNIINVSIGPKQIISPSRITITNPVDTLKRNISYLTHIEMDVPFKDAEGDIMYESSNPSVATYIDGVIKTYNAGKVELSVRSIKNDEVSFSFDLEVLEAEGIKPSSITLDIEDNYYINRESDISVTFNEVVEDENLTYIIEDEEVAIYENGLRGLKEGSTSIKACRMFDEAVCSSSYPLSIKKVEAEQVEIEINGQETDLIVGKRLQLKPLFTPQDVTIRNVTWSIDDVSSAKIGENGLILGLDTKVVKVSMHHEDSNLTAEKEFEIKKASTLTKKEKQDLSGRIRKVLGHFGLFMVNGFIGAFAFIDFTKKSKKQYVFVILIGFICSVVSELLQLIPKGRSCQISDMGINFIGFVFGILFAYIFHKIYFSIKRKKASKIENNK